MADSELADLTATTTLSTGDIFYVVRDPAGTPVDRKIEVEDAGTELGRLSGYGTFLRKVRQTLTDKSSFSGTGNEQWGTEEAVFDDALLPRLTDVTVMALLTGRVANPTSDAQLFYRVEISLDGGSTWDIGLSGSWRMDTGGTTDIISAVAAHGITGTVTGDIQARVNVSCSAGASTAYDLTNGVIYMDVLVSA